MQLQRAAAAFVSQHWFLIAGLIAFALMIFFVRNLDGSTSCGDDADAVDGGDGGGD